ncbi:MAG: TIGR00268 family protein, partial [Actinobacteria bacterium HGW-Actinobacteria-7]
CYYCKGELFSLLARVADVNGLSVVADGSNVDDTADFRPGSRAKSEYGVVSPLQDAGMTKDDIRTVARELGLPNWNKPAMACLASRFPYGEAITEESLARVAHAESALLGLGLNQFRVRAHGDVARLEVAPHEQEQAWRMRESISSSLRAAGFTWVAQDLDGYRMGALNEALPTPPDHLASADGSASESPGSDQ